MTATVAGRAIRSGTLSRQRVRQGRVLGPVLLTVVVLVAASLFYVWCRLQAVRVGYEQSRTAETLQQMEKVNEELRGEAARLKSPERIERLARERLGLKYPSPEQIRILDPSGE
jgi:cell division protein FtsL